MISPLLAAQLRKNWPLVGAVVVFVLFMALHVAVFRPAANRYAAALRSASELGMALDPNQPARMMPPRVFALLSDNSMPPGLAVEKGNSGVLASQLLEDVSRLTSKVGMDVMITEPGATTQQARAVQVRAYLRANCSYDEFVRFLDELSRSGTLISVDRFTLTSTSPGRHVLDLWVTRFVLKQQSGTRG